VLGEPLSTSNLLDRRSSGLFLLGTCRIAVVIVFGMVVLPSGWPGHCVMLDAGLWRLWLSTLSLFLLRGHRVTAGAHGSLATQAIRRLGTSTLFSCRNHARLALRIRRVIIVAPGDIARFPARRIATRTMLAGRLSEIASKILGRLRINLAAGRATTQSKRFLPTRSIDSSILGVWLLLSRNGPLSGYKRLLLECCIQSRTTFIQICFGSWFRMRFWVLDTVRRPLEMPEQLVYSI
jgi:hypothetical protein